MYDEVVSGDHGTFLHGSHVGQAVHVDTGRVRSAADLEFNIGIETVVIFFVSVTVVSMYGSVAIIKTNADLDNFANV